MFVVCKADESVGLFAQEQAVKQEENIIVSKWIDVYHWYDRRIKKDLFSEIVVWTQGISAAYAGNKSTAISGGVGASG